MKNKDLLRSVLIILCVVALSPVYAAIETPDTITTGSNTNIPVVLGKEVQGGYMIVSDIAERNAISDGRRAEGMLCYVKSDLKTYRLVGGINNSNWTEDSSEIVQGPDAFNPYGRWSVNYGMKRDKNVAQWNLSGTGNYFSTLWNKNESVRYYSNPTGQTPTQLGLAASNTVLTDDEIENFYKGTIIDSFGSGKYTGNLIVGGSVGVGTPAPASKLDVNGDIKLAGIATANMPSAIEGKIYYNSDTKRLNYYGDKWIEIDPAYTEKEIKLAVNDTLNIALSSGQLSATATMFTAPANGAIITNVSISTGAGQITKLLIEVTDQGGKKISYVRNTVGNTTYSDWANQTCDLPIPVKVKGPVSITVTATGMSGGQVVYLRWPMIQYIELPI
jgi:hypothetical protein